MGIIKSNPETLRWRDYLPAQGEGGHHGHGVLTAVMVMELTEEILTSEETKGLGPPTAHSLRG